MKKPAPVKKPKAVSGGAAKKAVHHKTHASHAEILKRHAAALKAAKTRARDKRLHRGWTPDGDVACCSARAVAECLRIASGLVLSDDDVLSLYWSTASDPDDGQSILEALSAACQVFPCAPRGQRISEVTAEELSLRTSQPWRSFGTWRPQPLILGLDLPYGQPHAVAVGPDGTWWSWGQPYTAADFPGAIIDEAWSVHWC